MASWNQDHIMLTKAGAKALAKVQTGQGQLTITRAVAGDQVVDTANLDQVENVPSKLDLSIIGRSESGDGGSIIQVQLSNINLTSAFQLNEIGIYATHSDNPDKEFLYIIAQVDTGTGDRVPAYNVTPVTATYDFYLYNLKSSDIEVTISASGLATVEQIQNLQKNMDANDTALSKRIGVVETKVSAIDSTAINNAIALSKTNQTELTKWKTTRIQQGKVTLYNKYVIDGCIVKPIDGTRNIQVVSDLTKSTVSVEEGGTTQTGGQSQTVTTTTTYYGTSHVYVDGMNISIKDNADSVAAIPKNSGNSAVTLYAYVGYDSSSKTYKVMVTDNPVGKLKLYRLVIPAGDVSENLNNVKFYDERRMERNNASLYSSSPMVSVALSKSMGDAPEYDVQLTVESASNRAAVGELYPFDKATNGFKIGMTGSADNVVIRWTAINPDLA